MLWKFRCDPPGLPGLEDVRTAGAWRVEEAEVEVSAGGAEGRVHGGVGHGVRPRGHRVVLLQLYLQHSVSLYSEDFTIPYLGLLTSHIKDTIKRHYKTGVNQR